FPKYAENAQFGLGGPALRFYHALIIDEVLRQSQRKSSSFNGSTKNAGPVPEKDRPRKDQQCQKSSPEPASLLTPLLISLLQTMSIFQACLSWFLVRRMMEGMALRCVSLALL